MRDERRDAGQAVEVNRISELDRGRLDVARALLLDGELLIEHGPRDPDIGLVGDVEPDRDVVDPLLLERLTLGRGIPLWETEREA